MKQRWLQKATDHQLRTTNLSHDAISIEIVMKNATKIKITKVGIYQWSVWATAKVNFFFHKSKNLYVQTSDLKYIKGPVYTSVYIQNKVVL